MDTVVAAGVARANARPLDDLAGLSPEKRRMLLYIPFEHPERVRSADGVTECPPTVMAVLLHVLAQTIRAADGIPLTTRGNLSRRVVADALAALEEAGVEPELARAPRRKEFDFPELRLVRLLMELGALGREYRGRLQLVRATQQKLERGDWGAIYRELLRSLRSHAREFNWAYQDAYPPLPTIQHEALFSLYLLARYGNQWLPARSTPMPSCGPSLWCWTKRRRIAGPGRRWRRSGRCVRSSGLRIPSG